MTERKVRQGIPMTEESLREWEEAFILIAESIKALYNEKQGGGNENFNRLYPVYLFKFMAINNYFNRGFCGLEVMGEK